MKRIFSKRMFSALNYSSKKINLIPVCLFFPLALLYHTSSAQICDKKTRVFFETDQFSIPSSEETKLHKLTREFSQKTDTFLLEIYAFTDSVASVAYNYKLAENRFKSIVKYLRKNSQCHFEIIEKVMGEASPLSNNATEEGRAKNRRVEIFYFKLSDGRITLKGKRGMEMAVSKDYFSPCGICETNPKLTEIYTNEEAAAAGIALTTTDGCGLITGGMINLGFSCKERPKPDENGRIDLKYCSDVTFKMPASKFNERMEIWNSNPENRDGTKMSKWYREEAGQLEYDEKNKVYFMTVKYCPGSGCNLDQLNPFGPGAGVGGPCDTRTRVRDSAGVIAVPDLIRSKNRRYFKTFNSTILTREGQTPVTLAKFRYSGKGQVFFVDSGMSKEKIGYYFSGSIENYEMECDSARCSRLNECWCYEIPLSAYTKILYFEKKKNYVLKIPGKYRNYAVKLFIPGADSIIPIDKVEGSKRKYTFKKPLADAYIVLYKEAAASGNKRAYDHQVDLEDVHKKYSKRKKVYKAKIRRRQLKLAN